MLKEIVPDPQDADLSDRNSPFQPYAPMAATRHVADTAPLPAIVPEPAAPKIPRMPFAPWRFLVVAAILIAAVPCGIAAAAPGIGGAEIAIGLLLAALVVVFRIPGEDGR